MGGTLIRANRTVSGEILSRGKPDEGGSLAIFSSTAHSTENNGESVFLAKTVDLVKIPPGRRGFVDFHQRSSGLPNPRANLFKW